MKMYLGVWPYEEALKKLIADLRSPDYATRIAAIQSLHAEGFWLREIVIALGQLGDPRALPVLNEALTQSNEDIRQAATLAISQITIQHDC